MKLNDAFPSNYIKAEDLAEGEEKEVTISKVVIEEMTTRDQSKENKPVLHFSDLNKQMVINATNWKRIAQVTGQEDSDNWTGKKIILCTEIVDAFGEMKPAIRVKLVSGKQVEINAFWTKVNEIFMSPDEARKVVAKHNGDFKAALADISRF